MSQKLYYCFHSVFISLFTVFIYVEMAKLSLHKQIMKNNLIVIVTQLINHLLTIYYGIQFAISLFWQELHNDCWPNSISL